ncbi:MAG: transporter substrate-binding domain-containing protein [Blautia sp.]|nr:transporter substrate-binding domain-containing protein [Blautia sp.]MDY5032229.1 transporter substrate-binding domain-containing protein [Blautia sp.]
MNKKALAVTLCAAMTASVLMSTTAFAEEKTWVVATDTVFKPFEYTNADNEFVGIDVDILAAVAEDQGFTYELQSLGWDSGVAAVQAGQADALIAGATIKQERIDSGWIFSDGYYNATQTFVVAEGSDIASFEDLEGKNVAVKNGTAGADFANSLKDEYGFTVTTFEDSPTMYQDVLLGNSAACVEDTPIMAASIQDGDLALQIPEGMESEGAPYGFAIMDEKNQELLDMFNAGLQNIIADGTYEEIIAKYLGEDAAKSAVAAFSASGVQEVEPVETEAAEVEEAETEETAAE